MESSRNQQSWWKGISGSEQSMRKGPGVLRGLAQESKDKARSLLPSEGEHGGGRRKSGGTEGTTLGLPEEEPA